MIDRYARDVCAGVFDAGSITRLACARHLGSRARGDGSFPYRLDWPTADRFSASPSGCGTTKGNGRAGDPASTLPTVSARLDLRVAPRRHRAPTVPHRVQRNPRKQGKSLEAAVVAVYVSFFDEPGAEGTIATKRDQAKIVFNDAKRLVQSSDLRS